MKLTDTKGNQFLKIFRRLIAGLESLRLEPFSEIDITGQLAMIGISTERFFAETIFPDLYKSLNGRGFFSRSIAELSKYNIDEIHRKDLHALREMYNNQKHVPNATLDLNFLIDISKKSLTALELVVSLGIGKTNSRVFENETIYWISGQDFFAEGLTEIYVHLPLETDTWFGPPLLVSRFVGGDGWDKLRNKLKSTGSIIDGVELLESDIIESLSKGTDSIPPYVYIGSFLPLVSELSSLRDEMRKKEINKRHHFESRTAPFLTFLVGMSICKEHAAEGIYTSGGELIKKIEDFFILSNIDLSKNSCNFSHEVKAVSSLMSQVPLEIIKRLGGPIWVDEDSFNRLSAIRNLISTDGVYAISPDLRIIVKAVKIDA